jgi:hypothetical protein
MRPQLIALASRQHDVVTRRQVLKAGVTDQELRSATGPKGPLVVVRRGSYMAREAWDALDDQGRMLRRDVAASLVMRRPHLLSHDAGVRAAALTQLRVDRPLTHVTRIGVQGSRTRYGVKHHLTRRPLVVHEHDGLVTTPLARTALDMAREHGSLHGVVVLDQVLRRGVTAAEVGEELASMRSWPGVTRAQAAVELANPDAESVAESVLRVRLEELGLGRPQAQFAVLLDDGRVVWCDLRIGCHMFEFDGFVKFVGREDGGVADRDPARVAWDERQRELAILRRGLGVSRVVWSELWGSRWDQAKRRLRAEYDETVRRFGTVLPEELRAFDARMHADRLRRRTR